MPDTLNAYWGTEQFSRDLPLPYVVSTSAGHSFGSEAIIASPERAEEGDSLIGIIALRFDAASVLGALPAGFEVIVDYVRAVEPDLSHIYLIRKEVTSTPEPAFYTFPKSAGGFICVSVHVVRGAGPIEQWVHSVPPPPGAVPAITTTKPNTLLMCGYTARFGMNQFIPPPPAPPEWEGVGSSYVTIHWNCYQRDAVVPGTYGPTPVSETAYAQDQFLVFAISPIPAPPTPDLTISSLEPASGVIPGGTVVTITGTSFALGATEVNIGGVTIPAEDVTVLSGTQLTFETPASLGGVKKVEPVTVTVGAYTSNERYFTYNEDAGFSPASIYGLQIWLDSSEMSTIDLSGTDIVEWRDLSANGYEFFSATSDIRPTYTADEINGMGVVTFADDFLESRTQQPGERPRTFCWVMEPESGLMAIFSVQSKNDPRIEITAENEIYLNCGVEVFTGVDATGLHVWTLLFNAMESALWRDGVLVWEGDPGSSLLPGLLQIGTNGVGWTYSGMISEVVTYETKLTTTEREDLETYLFNKWAGGPYAPSAPVLLSVVTGDASAELDWNAPISNGGAAITDYVVERSLDGSTGWTVLSEGTSTTTNAEVTGLTNGTLYHFRVAAVNSVGVGAYSNVMTGTPVASTPPSAPVVDAPVASDGQLELSWDAPSSDGGEPITDYIIQQSLNGTSGWTTLTDGVGTDLSYLVTGLTNETPYYFRVSAVNSVGTSSPSNVEMGVPTSEVAALWVDDFNRVNGSAGPNWVVINGSVEIVSNELRTVTGNGRDCVIWAEHCATQNQVSETVMDVSANGLETLPCLVRNNGTWTFPFPDGYMVFCYPSYGLAVVKRSVAGSNYDVGSVDITDLEGFHTFRLEAVTASGGSVDLTLFVDGTQRWTGNDPSAVTGTRVGFGWSYSGSSTARGRVNSWTGGDLT